VMKAYNKLQAFYNFCKYLAIYLNLFYTKCKPAKKYRLFEGQLNKVP
jgi:hypothetical protein